MFIALNFLKEEVARNQMKIIKLIVYRIFENNVLRVADDVSSNVLKFLYLEFENVDKKLQISNRYQYSNE